MVVGCKEKPAEPELMHDLQTLSKVIADMEFAEQLIAKAKDAKNDTLRLRYINEIEEIHNVKLTDIQKDITEIQKSDVLYRQLMDSTILILNRKSK